MLFAIFCLSLKKAGWKMSGWKQGNICQNSLGTGEHIFQQRYFAEQIDELANLSNEGQGNKWKRN